MKKQNCGNCKFFYVYKGCFRHLGLKEGACRRFPPSFSQGKYINGQGDFWPLVVSDSWCGEFKKAKL